MTKHWITSRRVITWAAGSIALLILTIAGIVAYTQRAVSSPLHGAAVATYDLSMTAQNLQQSFARLPNSSKATTADYIKYMNRMQQDCNNIQQHKAAAQQTGVPAEVTQLLNSSVSLCVDLTMLASDSEQIYSAVSPLMSANPRIKRYQTLPFIKNNLRADHEANVESAITKLSELDKANKDYQSSALPLLKQLQNSINSSQGLDYTSALQNFQNQLLAERQQYWTGYAGLSSLQAALNSQLHGYCQAINAQDSSLRVCNSIRD